jgi:predicted HicB family RNase H-like nuclease
MRFPADLIEAARTRAERDDESLAQWVRRALRERLARSEEKKEDAT